MWLGSSVMVVLILKITQIQNVCCGVERIGLEMHLMLVKKEANMPDFEFLVLTADKGRALHVSERGESRF